MPATAAPTGRKAPFWFVVVKAAAKSYPKVFCFLPKGGKNAQSRARAYAEKLARRDSSTSVYVLRPRAKYAMPTGLQVKEY